MATLTLDNLPGALRSAAEMIDSEKDFSAFDESQLVDLASVCREVAVEYGECSVEMAQAKNVVQHAAAGAFHDGLHQGFAELAGIADAKKDALNTRAENLVHTAELIHDIKARFFEIVTIYWQRAQSYGCKDPSSLDALLRSNTTWVLEDARRSWKGLVDKHDN